MTNTFDRPQLDDSELDLVHGGTGTAVGRGLELAEDVAETAGGIATRNTVSPTGSWTGDGNAIEGAQEYGGSTANTSDNWTNENDRNPLDGVEGVG